MKITYDPEADAMYIQIKTGKVHATKEVDDNTIIDLDKNSDILGIELLFVKERNSSIVTDLMKIQKQITA